MEIEKSAASVEDAVEAALRELGISEQEARIEVVQEPRGGLLGLGSQPAVVRVRTAKETFPAEPVTEAAVDEQAELGADFLEGLMEAMDLDVEVDIVEEDGQVYLDVVGAESSEGMGILIGKHGATLDALQELVRAAVQRTVEERFQAQVDVEDYRKRRRAQIVRRAREAGKKVLATGRDTSMGAMTPYERKVVHDTIARFEGLSTHSEGDEPDRHVVITTQG